MTGSLATSNPCPAIAYRSPAGRVMTFGTFGEIIAAIEPGEEAVEAWDRLAASGMSCHDGAKWRCRRGR